MVWFMVGCTAKHQCHDILISPSCQRLPGEDVCLPCERGKVAGQAPGLRWWIWRPVHPCSSWNMLKYHSSSGRMSWISGMIWWIKHDQAPNTIVIDRGCHTLTWHVDLLDKISWFLSQFPSSNGDLSARQPAVLPIFTTYYSPIIHRWFPQFFVQKGWHACLHGMPIGRVPGQHSSSAKVAGFVLPGQFHLFHYPLVNEHSNGKSPCLMGKSTIHGHFQ